MTQMRLAVEIGGSEVAVRRLERGVQTPTVTTFILIASALKIAPTELVAVVIKRITAMENAAIDDEEMQRM